MYYHYKETLSKANALWAIKAAKDRKEYFYDPTHQADMLVESSPQKSSGCSGEGAGMFEMEVG